MYVMPTLLIELSLPITNTCVVVGVCFNIASITDHFKLHTFEITFAPIKTTVIGNTNMGVRRET